MKKAKPVQKPATKKQNSKPGGVPTKLKIKQALLAMISK